MDDFDFSLADWQQGLTIHQLIKGMGVNREAMERRFRTVELSDEEMARLSSFTSYRKLLVVTEEWCSDCLMNLPILAKMAEAAPSIEMRFFIRKDWPSLRTYFTGRDVYSLPTVLILDESLNPLAIWVERPQAAHQALADWKDAHPEVEHTRRRADLTSEQKREMLRQFSDLLLAEMEDWYAQRLQSETVREVTEILEALEPSLGR